VDTPQALRALASAARLMARRVEKVRVNTGVDTADELLRWRLGMAHLAPFVAGLSPAQRARLECDAKEALGPRASTVASHSPHSFQSGVGATSERLRIVASLTRQTCGVALGRFSDPSGLVRAAPDICADRAADSADDRAAFCTAHPEACAANQVDRSEDRAALCKEHPEACAATITCAMPSTSPRGCTSSNSRTGAVARRIRFACALAGCADAIRSLKFAAWLPSLRGFCQDCRFTS